MTTPTSTPKSNELQLYFKRAKLFTQPRDGGERTFQAAISKDGPIPVPDWVKQTLTYQLGIKDRSIIDLTEPGRRGKTKEAQAAVAVQTLSVDIRDGIGVNAVDVLNKEPELVAAGSAPNAPAFGNAKTTRPKGLGARAR